MTDNTLANSVQIGAGMCTESNGSLSIDWIRARKYASTEASTSDGVERNNHTTGIDNQDQLSDINIYPNPTHDIINVDLKNSNMEFENLELIDMNGKTVLNLNISVQKANREIHTANFDKGNYMLRLNGKNGNIVRKVTID
jgi:hypothetical protein